MRQTESRQMAGLLMQQLYRHLKTCPTAIAPPQVACDIRQNTLFVTGTLPFAARMPSAQVDSFLRGIRSQIRMPVGRQLTVERLDTNAGTVTLSIPLNSNDH